MSGRGPPAHRRHTILHQDQAFSVDLRVWQLFQQVTDTPANHANTDELWYVRAILPIQVLPDLNEDTMILPRFDGAHVENKALTGPQGFESTGEVRISVASFQGAEHARLMTSQR